MIDPQLLFEKGQLRTKMYVADFGCGRTGHIVFPAARILGDKGIVYAVDILQNVLQHIAERAAHNAQSGIQTIWSDVERVGATAIPVHSLDIVFIVNTLVQTHNRYAVLDEAHRVLKDKGRCVIVDWTKKGLTFGPVDEQFVNFDELIKYATTHGFTVQETFQAGPYHTGMVLYKIPEGGRT